MAVTAHNLSESVDNTKGLSNLEAVFRLRVVVPIGIETGMCGMQ